MMETNGEVPYALRSNIYGELIEPGQRGPRDPTGTRRGRCAARPTSTLRPGPRPGRPAGMISHTGVGSRQVSGGGGVLDQSDSW
jgi:hypothetical protein